MTQPIKIFLATQKTETEFKKTIPYKVLKKLWLTGDVDGGDIAYENKIGLSWLYNGWLSDNPDTICVFIHDDVHIWDLLLAEKLRFGHQYSKILGLAGTTKLDFNDSTPSAWHMMTAPGDNLSGLVFHQDKEQGRWPTVFGRVPKECIFLDGLFLSILNDGEFRDSGVQFDEDFDFMDEDDETEGSQHGADSSRDHGFVHGGPARDPTTGFDP